MARHLVKPAGFPSARSEGAGPPDPGRTSAASPAATQRAFGGIMALGLGYLLFLAVFLAEAAYTLPRKLNPDCLGMAGHWFAASLALSPLRSFAEGPCQRFPQLGAGTLVAAVVLLGLGYLAVLRAVQRHPEGWTLPRLLAGAGLAALPLLLLLPPTSQDYLAYLFGGRVASVYHLNPWHHTLAEFPSEHNYLAPAIWGGDYRFIYGPVWALVMAAVTAIVQAVAPGRLTPESFLVGVGLLRVANIAALIAAGNAVWRINGRLWPGQQRLVTAAFLLNPLLVYEAVGALHNDIWGLMLLLWACDLFLRDDIRFVAPLALSILTKYIAFAFVPLLCVYYARRRDWRRLGWLALGLLVSLALAWPTLTEDLVSHLILSTPRLIWSPTAMPLFIFSVLQMATGLTTLGAVVLAVTRMLTILFIPVYLTLLWRTRTREQVIENGLWALALYFAAVYVQTMQWYYVWPLGLLCLLRWTRATANLVWASGAVLLGYLHYFGTHNRWSLPLLAGCFLLAVILPALIGLAGRCGWWSALPLPATADATGLPAPGPGRSGSFLPRRGKRGAGGGRGTAASTGGRSAAKRRGTSSAISAGRHRA